MASTESRVHHPRDYPQGAVVAVVYKDARFLTIKRSEHVKAPGKICFAGGGVESDEHPRDAIVREMREELGVVVKPIGHVWTGTTPGGVSLQFWHVRLESGQTLRPNPEEVEHYAWYDAASLRKVPDLLVSTIDFLDRWDAGEIVLPDA